MVHASVIRVVVDYLLLAARRLDQSVEIVIADTPLQSADFDLLCEQNGLADLMRDYREQGAPVSLLDLRSERAVINDSFLILERRRLPGDPAGSLVIDLGTRSLHYEKTGDSARYSIQDYDDGVTQQNHSGRVHHCCFSRTILDADLVINLSKLKTHGKAGVTLAMKNIIGANVSKDYLPHFLTGGPRQGGDEFSSNSGRQVVVRRVRDFFYRHPALAPAHRILKSAAYSFEQQKSRGGDVNAYAGAWHGNDTVWRTIVDINRALTFADAAGALADSPHARCSISWTGSGGWRARGRSRARTATSACWRSATTRSSSTPSSPASWGSNRRRYPTSATGESRATCRSADILRASPPGCRRGRPPTSASPPAGAASCERRLRPEPGQHSMDLRVTAADLRSEGVQHVAAADRSYLLSRLPPRLADAAERAPAALERDLRQAGVSYVVADEAELRVVADYRGNQHLYCRRTEGGTGPRSR